MLVEGALEGFGQVLGDEPARAFAALRAAALLVLGPAVIVPKYALPLLTKPKPSRVSRYRFERRREKERESFKFYLTPDPTSLSPRTVETKPDRGHVRLRIVTRNATELVR